MTRPLTSTLASTPLPVFASDPTRACYGVDPRLFFPPADGDNGVGAKRVCRRCPFIEPCREYAVSITDLHGVWGGTTPLERRRLRHG